MITLKSLLAEAPNVPVATATIDAEVLQKHVKAFAARHGETVKGVTQGPATDALEQLYTSINRIVGALQKAGH